VHLFHDEYGEEEAGLSPFTVVGVPELSVSAALNTNFKDYIEIADKLDAIPWDILTICRRLVRKGLAVEGIGDLRGFFKR
jgi:hypothetical protein